MKGNGTGMKGKCTQGNNWKGEFSNRGNHGVLYQIFKMCIFVSFLVYLNCCQITLAIKVFVQNWQEPDPTRCSIAFVQ